MPPTIHPVLLAGGAGTRLWPVSRKSHPKQFAKLLGDESLFQASARRTSGDLFHPPIVVTTTDFRFVVAEHLAALGITPAATLLEPVGMNTAAAVCAAALTLAPVEPNALMLVAPSDHVIPDTALFRQNIGAGVNDALGGQIVTFGIRPDRPETGYGWLALAEPLGAGGPPTPQPLRGFVEKPDAATAAALMSGGMHLWNSGIVLSTVSTLLEAFARHAPDVLASARAAVAAARPDLSFTRLDPAAWASCPDVSLDYAVMERATNLSVVPYDGAWSDLGDWLAVWREAGPNPQGVVATGSTTALDCADTLLHATETAQHLVGIGLENIIAIAMPDAVLIARKDRAQDVKAVVASLKAAGIPQSETLPRDFRPWGWYESLVLGHRFQVKRIVVHSGAALSMQSHTHRAEHWIVVQGTARVTIEGTQSLITENQSVYIPLGAKHRLENPGKLPLMLIEVQTGAYLGEDDIQRYDDLYDRGQGRA